jgi:uncharacterized SAM-binding protein YcdF (DUF218 family)
VTAAVRGAPPGPLGADAARPRARAARRPRPLRALLGATCVLTGVAWLGSLAAVVLTAHHDAATRADAIVVLGAAQYDGRPSPVLRARLDHAVALYHGGFAPRLIVTGGNRRGDRATEAGVGRQYALARGVPDSAILIESEGRSTRESLRAAAVLLRHARSIAAGGGGAAGDAPEADLPTADAPNADAPNADALAPNALAPSDPTVTDSTPERETDVAGAPRRARLALAAAPPPTAILVSDPFHLLRLAVLARRFGLRPYPSAAPASPIGASSRLAWKYYLRESVKVPFVLLTEKLDEDE